MGILCAGRVWRRGILLSLWVVLGGLPAVWADPPFVTLVWSKGTVTVRRAGTAIYVPVTERMALSPGDIVRTDADAEAVLRFPSGAKLKLLANTLQAIPALRRDDALRRPGWEPGAGPHPQPSGSEAHLKVPGSVMVRRSGTGVFVLLAPDATLNPGDMVRTGDHSSVALRFADGSQVRLRENTCLIVPSAAGRTVVLRIHIGDRHEPVSPATDGGRMKPHTRGDLAPLDRADLEPSSAPTTVRVLVRRSGTRMFAPLTPETILGPGDLVRTSPNSSVTLHFADGSQTRLKGNCWLLIPPTAGRTVVSDLRADKAR
jgi:hypothetical protein